MGKIDLTRAADNDLLDIAEYIARDNRDAADRFYRAAEAAFVQIADMPGIGKLRGFKNSRVRDLRSWAIGGFENYLVFYRPIPGGIQIVRVFHGARDIDAAFGG